MISPGANLFNILLHKRGKGTWAWDAIISKAYNKEMSLFDRIILKYSHCFCSRPPSPFRPSSPFRPPSRFVSSPVPLFVNFDRLF